MEETLTRDQYMILIDKNKGEGTPEWIQVKYTESHTLNFNPQEETKAWIFQKNDSTSTTGYQPELPVDTKLIKGDPFHDFLYEEFIRKLPVGMGCKVPVARTYHTDDKGVPADLFSEAEISLQSHSPSDGIVSASIKLNGDPTPGHFTVNSGNLEFAPDSEEPETP